MTTNSNIEAYQYNISYETQIKIINYYSLFFKHQKMYHASCDNITISDYLV